MFATRAAAAAAARGALPGPAAAARGALHHRLGAAAAAAFTSAWSRPAATVAAAHGRFVPDGARVAPGTRMLPAPPSLLAAAISTRGLSCSAAARAAPADVDGMAAAPGHASAVGSEVWPPRPPPRNDLGVDWGGRGIDMSTFGLYERVTPPGAAAASEPPPTVEDANVSDGITLSLPSFLAADRSAPLPEVLGVHGPRRLWAGDASAGNGLLTVVSESDVSVVEAGGGGGGIFAIVAIGGDQVKVTADDVFYAERLPGAVNSPLVLTAALLVGTVKWSVIGRPTVPGVRVHCVVEEQTRSRKTVTIKFKRRKGYRRTLGHRQHITRLRVVRIEYHLPPAEEWTNLKVRDAGVALPPQEKWTSPY